MFFHILIPSDYVFWQSSTTPVVENQNSMGGEDMDADSNNNHDQTTFPPATGGFTFNTPTAGTVCTCPV